MSVTRPTTDARMSHCRHSASTSSRSTGRTIASIRSWLSDVITSTAFIPGSRWWHACDVDVHARAGLGRGLRRRARQARGAEVLHSDREAGVEQREARLDEPLLLERITDLHRRALGLRALVEAGRREDARAADAVATGRRAEQHREVALALGPGEHEAVLGQQPEAEHVDERVVAVAVVEDDLAADGRHADRVAVAADARHDALEQVAGAGVVERAEAQRVHQRDRDGRPSRRCRG